jgi:hypothetical protein
MKDIIMLRLLKSIPKTIPKQLATRESLRVHHSFRYFSSINTFDQQHLNQLLKHAIVKDNDYMIVSLLDKKQIQTKFQ